MSEARLQVLVVGLGQFGMSFAKAMSDHGNEVIAVDSNPRLVSDVAQHVAEALQLDAMDEQALEALGPGLRDLCVCAIGDENREASIIVTALLAQLGARRVIARATDPLHARILRRVGASEVINPERVFGERLAMRLSWGNVLNVLPVGGDLVLTELEAPESVIGRSLAELSLPSRFSVSVAAVRALRSSLGAEAGTPETPQEEEEDQALGARATRKGGEEGEGGGGEGDAQGRKLPTRVSMIPEAHRPFQRGDTLLLVGTELHTRLLMERFK